MLASRNYETPNAIDPGEAPPSRPSRRVVSNPPSVDDVRLNAARLLQAADESSPPTPVRRTRGASSFRNADGPTFPYDAADNTDEISIGEVDDDGDIESNSNNSHSFTQSAAHSLPSVEDARLYAGRILSARSMRDLSPESAERAHLTPFEQEKQTQHASIGKGVPLIVPPHVKAARRRCIKRCVYATLALGLMAVIIGLSVRVSQANRANNSSTSTGTSTSNTTPQNSTPSKASPRLAKTIEVISRYEISKRADVSQLGTAQNHAAIWLADHDALAITIPDSPTNQDEYKPFVQRYVMALLFFQLNGNDWNSQLLFLDKVHECSWFERDNLSDGEVVAVGVTCDLIDDLLQVTELLMPRNNLAGSLPSELAHLTRLHFVDLNRNAITGSIPNEIEDLANMQFFDLRYNQITGTIPRWIGETWTRLTELALSDNLMTGTLPFSMNGLHQLKSLSLANNEFVESLDPIMQLNSLEFLYLEKNAFQGQVNDDFMQGLENLIQLDISSNSLTSTDLPVHLFQHPKLLVLDLGDNDLMGTFPLNLEDNSVIQYIALNDNIITGSLPATLDQFNKLHHLDMTDNDLTGTMPPSFSSMTDLTYLFLSENNFTPGPIPPFFSAMHQLRELSLSNTERTGTIPKEWIGGLANLVLFDVSYNKMNGTIPPVLWELPALSYLLLNRNEFTGTIPAGISDAKHLDLFLLDKNSVSGDLNEACGLHQVQHYIVDCEEIVCDCCTCCSDYEVRCNDDLLYTNQDFSFENNYTRTSYAFSPQILFEASRNVRSDGSL